MLKARNANARRVKFVTGGDNEAICLEPDWRPSTDLRQLTAGIRLTVRGKRTDPSNRV